MNFSTRLSILISSSLVLFLGCGISEFDTSGISTLGGALGVEDGTDSGDSNNDENTGAGSSPVVIIPDALEVLRGGGASNSNGDATNPISLVSTLCSERARTLKTVNIEFLPPATTCEWGIDGNLNPRNFFFQARREQLFTLDLPEGAVICDMDFDFPAEQFFYDDQFILSLNDTVLTSSFNYSNLFSKGTNGLTLYNWNNIVGTNWDFELTNQYCATLPGVPSSCMFPASSEAGISDMEFESEHIMTAMANGVPLQGNHFFRLSSIGDNDETDCGHAGLNFSVVVDYVK